MSDEPPNGGGTPRRGGQRPGLLRGLLWGVLIVSAAAHLVRWGLVLQFSHDTEYLESTLAIVAAGPFADGAGSLYGPFRGTNHRLLVHAPLYYRLTALAAWPLVAFAPASWPPVSACLAAGRLISFGAFAWTLASLFRLATLDGTPRRAGVLTVLLVLGSWVFGDYPITVRPDLLGVALQTAGALAVSRALYGPGASAARPNGLGLAAVYLALAFCVKQHNIGVALASVGLVLWAGRVRRAGWSWWASVLGSGLTGLAVVGVDFGAEELTSGGGMSRCVFGTAVAFRELAYAGWSNSVGIGLEAVLRSSVLVALAVAAWVCRPADASAAGPAGSALRVYFAAECVLSLWLFAGSEGAWLNYALQPIALAAVLAGRALARATPTAAPPRRPWFLAVALLCAAAFEGFWTYHNVRESLFEEVTLNVVTADPRVASRPRRELYFAGEPGLNRIFGRSDLTHDEWLYGLFERVRGVEPRTAWLRPALTRGVRVVVVPTQPRISFPTDPPVLPGLKESLPDLGYDEAFRFGRYRVWERRREPSPERP